ncbi:MAG: hypothetical protein M1837_004281 [Sclerophora amabilis]|nr:MAG: hypothetical protein M1837_004281 [Sclerophora amabilis]
MLSSLPLITPQDAHTLWNTLPNHPASSHPIPSDLSSSRHHHPHRATHNQAAAAAAAARYNPLAQLRADENFIQNRKLNIQRFGATWIRPPGVGKTYQASMDEAAEREEAERMAERETMMVEMADDGDGDEVEDDGGEGGEEERDLDAEVPDADAPELEDDDDEDGLEIGDDDDLDLVDAAAAAAAAAADDDGDGDERELLEVDVDEQMLADRDLDDDVPEAGSYQHTDSEVEDFSDEPDEFGGGLDAMGRFSGNHALQATALGMASGRNSLVNAASSILESSPAAVSRGRVRQGRRE